MILTDIFRTKTNSIDNYPASLQRLIGMLKRSTTLTPDRVKDLVLAAGVSEMDLMSWADFTHPIADSYGRKLIFDGEYFEIMAMSWLPGDFSAIHDHGATQWGAVQCFGVAEHYIYSFTNGVLRTLKPAHYSPGMAYAVDRHLIHQMGNSGNEPFLSLHVYGKEGTGGTITGNARIFDILEGNIQYTDGGVFFCLPETQINQRLAGLKADRETTLRHHRLMRDRLRRILEIQHNVDLKQKLTLLDLSIN